jgi:tRNA(Met) cytidine acetyltransferase
MIQKQINEQILLITIKQSVLSRLLIYYYRLYMPTIQNLHRQLIIISDTFSNTVQSARDFTANTNVLWLSNESIEGQETLALSKATTLLGQAYQIVVFNTHNGDDQSIAFDANAFGAVTGTIIGGGYLVLLTPALSQWKTKSRFVQRFIYLLQGSFVTFYTKDNPPFLTNKATTLAPYHNPILIDEQHVAFDAMWRVMQGHRRRPLVLSADRGRGKSTILGKFAAHLLQQGKCTLIVTAPSRKIAETLFNAAKIALDSVSNANNLLEGLRFLSPDELQQQKPTADLVLVDEAASIPLPMLSNFVKQHSRLIFATTEHGYEGSGRGFTLRFSTLLDRLCPQWHRVQLKQSFRWQANDPLELFSFNALLLNAEIVDVNNTSLLELMTSSSAQLLSNCEIARIEQDDLLANETQLREIFGLFVSAHYQTKPSDLVRLLDDDNYLIFTVRYKTHLVATALLAKEGGFSEALAEDIYHGNRRPQGHLIPQLLATHAGIKQAPCYQCYRIMRVAVHPELQGRGIGSHLLQYLIKYSQQQSDVDYIATSFGATPELVSFWHKAGFKAVQIGMKRDASSGLHSVIMLHPLSIQADKLQATARENFKQALPHLLADPLRDLEASIIAALFTPSLIKNRQKKLRLNEAERYILYGFTEQQRGYENSIAVIHKLTLHSLSKQHLLTILTPEELQIVIAKVLQKQHWQILAKLTKVNGKKQALICLRKAIKKLVYLC